MAMYKSLQSVPYMLGKQHNGSKATTTLYVSFSPLHSCGNFVDRI